MEHFYLVLYQWLQTYGLPATSLFMAAESAGAPVPTELGFVTAQGLVLARSVTYVEAFLWIAAGHLVGSGVSFYLGRATDSALARKLASRRSVMHVRAKLQGWYARYGALTVLFGRLMGHVRPWASFIAGLSQVDPRTFWLWTVVGTFIFTAVTMWVTAVGWQFWLAYPQWRMPLIVGMLLVFYGIPLYKIVEHLVKRRRRRKAYETAE
ncbi:MAG: VTT domain-containing protein [Armatimonadetes bacterium]|nr:VTT domain-containing protein [Armatimonadota bacterium]